MPTVKIVGPNYRLNTTLVTAYHHKIIILQAYVKNMSLTEAYNTELR